MARELNDLTIIEQTAWPVIVKAEAPWCEPCKTLAPIIEDLCEKYGVPLYTLDVDKYADIALGLGITGLPTVLGFWEGSLEERVTPDEANAESIKRLICRVDRPSG